MTKSAVRAMDTVTSLLRHARGRRRQCGQIRRRRRSQARLDHLDHRRRRQARRCRDPDCDRHAQRAEGRRASLLGVRFFRHRLQDYVDMKIPSWTGTPQYAALLKIEEPYEYRERLTMPKFIINATGDQYFPPDNSQFYFDDLRRGEIPALRPQHGSFVERVRRRRDARGLPRRGGDGRLRCRSSRGRGRGKEPSSWRPRPSPRR